MPDDLVLELSLRTRLAERDDRIAELESHLAALLRAGEPFERKLQLWGGNPSWARAMLVDVEYVRALAAALAKAREGTPK